MKETENATVDLRIAEEWGGQACIVKKIFMRYEREENIFGNVHVHRI